MYSTLAKQALAGWRSELHASEYVESGIVVLADESSPSATYVRQALAMNLTPAANGSKAYELKDGAAIKATFPAGIATGSFESKSAYLNPNCGYAFARLAMDNLCSRVRKAGVSFICGKADALMYDEEDDEGRTNVVGARLADGSTLSSDFVVVAAGSWTSALCPEFRDDLLSSGQIVGTIQLLESEAQLYKATPVVFSMDSGFYIFPPTADHVVKFAIHGAGYAMPGFASDGTALRSTPRTKDRVAHQNDNIPREAVRLLKDELRKVYPSLAAMKWKESRLCWYTDSSSSNFLIDYHQSHPNVFLATAGSGHAFKFLPIMRDFIQGSLEKKLPLDQALAWSYEQLRYRKGDASRGGLGMPTAKLLKVEDMAGSDEL